MSTLRNVVRKGFYADSVALMRVAREVAGAPGVAEASLMIGTPSNQALLAESGLLAAEGRAARPEDLIIALRAKSPAHAQSALELAGRLLASRPEAPAAGGVQTYASAAAAAQSLSSANLALISIPGAFAAAEARRALERGLHVLLFSDNVPVPDEIRLKKLAISRGLLMMGPDCGTALIGGTPLAFANAVPRGDVGLVSASGTGLQEVSTLLARRGEGVSQGIGVGGRDLSRQVGGLMTLAALDALEADPATKRIVVISKPPAPAVTRKIVARAKRYRKPVVLCLLGARAGKGIARTLEEAAGFEPADPAAQPARGSIRGLFCGGTLCAEAQIVLLDHGLDVSSNAAVPGASEKAARHVLLDLGDDQYTRGRPHPMIEPALRNDLLERALADNAVGVILLDVVIGYGAHPDPAGLLAGVLKKHPPRRKLIVASVTGTDADPQGYGRQVRTLQSAGVIVAPSNAGAARVAARAVGGR